MRLTIWSQNGTWPISCHVIDYGRDERGDKAKMERCTARSLRIFVFQISTRHSLLVLDLHHCEPVIDEMLYGGPLLVSSYDAFTIGALFENPAMQFQQ
jgi:hypothetical protein